MGTRANTMGLGGNMGLGFPVPDLGDAGGMGLMDPVAMQQMLQNPAVLQMMRNLLSDPQYMNQVNTTASHCSQQILFGDVLCSVWIISHSISLLVHR
jgi:hypothetical protein